MQRERRRLAFLTLRAALIVALLCICSTAGRGADGGGLSSSRSATPEAGQKDALGLQEDAGQPESGSTQPSQELCSSGTPSCVASGSSGQPQAERAPLATPTLDESTSSTVSTQDTAVAGSGYLSAAVPEDQQQQQQEQQQVHMAGGAAATQPSEEQYLHPEAQAQAAATAHEQREVPPAQQLPQATAPQQQQQQEQQQKQQQQEQQEEIPQQQEQQQQQSTAAPAQQPAATPASLEVPAEEHHNFALSKEGAKVLAANKEAKKASALLDDDSDTFLKNDCRAESKWVMLELSQVAKVSRLELSQFELYSARVREFEVLGRQSHPRTDGVGSEYSRALNSSAWKLLGNFTAEKAKGTQSFPIERPRWVRYLLLRFLSQHGPEPVCALNGVSVYGRSAVEELEEQLAYEEGLGLLPADLEPAVPAAEPAVVPAAIGAGAGTAGAAAPAAAVSQPVEPAGDVAAQSGGAGAAAGAAAAAGTEAAVGVTAPSLAEQQQALPGHPLGVGAGRPHAGEPSPQGQQQQQQQLASAAGGNTGAGDASEAAAAAQAAQPVASDAQAQQAQQVKGAPGACAGACTSAAAEGSCGDATNTSSQAGEPQVAAGSGLKSPPSSTGSAAAGQLAADHASPPVVDQAGAEPASSGAGQAAVPAAADLNASSAESRQVHATPQPASQEGTPQSAPGSASSGTGAGSTPAAAGAAASAAVPPDSSAAPAPPASAPRHQVPLPVPPLPSQPQQQAPLQAGRGTATLLRSPAPAGAAGVAGPPAAAPAGSTAASEDEVLELPLTGLTAKSKGGGTVYDLLVQEIKAAKLQHKLLAKSVAEVARNASAQYAELAGDIASLAAMLAKMPADHNISEEALAAQVDLLVKAHLVHVLQQMAGLQASLASAAKQQHALLCFLAMLGAALALNATRFAEQWPRARWAVLLLAAANGLVGVALQLHASPAAQPPLWRQALPGWAH